MLPASFFDWLTEHWLIAGERGMSCWKIALYGMLASGASISAASAQLNPQQIQIIQDTAASICNTVKEAKGQNSEVKVQGDINAQLGGLVGKLAGASAKGSLTKEEFEGLSREATAIAKEGDRTCRERVFYKMFDKLSFSPDVGPGVPAPPAVAVVPPVRPDASRGCGGDVTTVSWSSRSAGVLSAAEECALKPKDSFRECSQCPVMVVAPSGSFTMGSPDSEKNRDKDEGPQHRVTFTRQFAVGKFAVAFDEWDACVADGGCKGYKPDDKGWGRGRRPVINVSWDDANEYLAWLSLKTKKTYRLLSESEREYVARAETSTPYWWGPSVSTQQANFDDEDYQDLPHLPSRRTRTVPVNSFKPNPWGLYQVHGNVEDWTQDCYHNNYTGAPSDGSPWTSGDCGKRAVRGGYHASADSELRSASRSYSLTNVRSVRLGFRVGRTLAPESRF
jgi:formylglycine-generating enzyme required for sulfatase activity